jgi:hypothetical protein
MDETTGDAVINELIEKAVSRIDPVALQLRDALENLESGEVLAALGALTGCEEAIRSANLVLAITHDYQEKLNRARRVVADSGNQAERSGSPEDSEKLQGSPKEHSDSAIEVFLPDAEFGALSGADVIASGYEFNCPACETYNTLIAIPKHGKAVECHNCHARFRIDEVTDAHE